VTRSSFNTLRRLKAASRWHERRIERRRTVATRVFSAMNPQMLFVPSLGPQAPTWPIWKIRRYAYRHGFKFADSLGYRA
jgi:hypothetical protein